MTKSISRNAGSLATARLFAALVSWIIISAGATAQNVGTTFTDLWWNPAESGWGVTVDHQQDVMFLTFFVYRADRSPYWVTAVLDRRGSNSISAPPIVFTGDVYETSGPWFGGPFNPSAVTNRKVGTATFSGDVATATLRYSIDGISVTKDIYRQTLQALNFTGLYLGGFVFTMYNCVDPANNGGGTSEFGVLSIQQDGTSVRLGMESMRSYCLFSGGAYGQTGSLGLVNEGTYSCADGTRGTFVVNRMQWTIYGMSAGIYGRNQFCSFYGSLGGVTTIHRGLEVAPESRTGR